MAGVKRVLASRSRAPMMFRVVLDLEREGCMAQTGSRIKAGQCSFTEHSAVFWWVSLRMTTGHCTRHDGPQGSAAGFQDANNESGKNFPKKDGRSSVI